MAATTTVNGDRSKQVMVGDLPPDFLRLPTTNQQQIANDHQAALMMQAQQANMPPAVFSPHMARISITVAQAKLTKNYGLTKMDPYCRMRLGHSVLETPTDHSGGKNPRWNKAVQCYVPQGVDALYIEIFDERAFTMDDRIAWAHVPIPDKVFQGQTVDEWYPLNGKQGDAKEGMINLVMTYSAASAVSTNVYQVPPMQPMVMVPAGMPMYYPPVVAGGMPGVPVTVGPPPGVAMQRPPPGPAYTEQDIQQVKDMFPAVDDEVVRSVFEMNMGNKDKTINDMLAISNT